MRVTVTVDGSYDFSTRIAGIGLVVRQTDERGPMGPVVAEVGEAYDAVTSGEVEAFAILRALEVAQARGAESVTVRSDYNSLRTRLKEDHRDGSGAERSDLCGRILRLARTFSAVRFAYQPRRKNQRAHGLARAARSQPPLTRA